MRGPKRVKFLALCFMDSVVNHVLRNHTLYDQNETGRVAQVQIKFAQGGHAVVVQ